MPIANQGTCQSRKTAENRTQRTRLGDFANQELVGFPTRWREHSPRPARRSSQAFKRGSAAMLGKLAGAWIGEKVAGRNRGARGAILGYCAAAMAKRSVPLLAGAALGAWAFRKWRGK